MEANEVLNKFKETGALLEGHFVLRSGLHSRQYFQCAGLLQHPVIAAEICAALAKKAQAFEASTVISPAMGGILVGHEVARNLNKRHIFAEKQEGKLVMRRFQVREGERFIVAEDVITTGSAVQETCQLVRDAGGVVAGVVTIVDRSGDAKPDFGAPYESLLQLQVETFEPEHLPEDLKNTPVVKPGSV
ncbi:MAG: orotate phosphoribosyltransferase [Verrucomicrobiota bacterium]